MSKYASLFKLFRDVESQKAEQECSKRRRDIDRKFEAERATVLGNARKILLDKDRKSQGQEKCTDVVGLLKTRVGMAVEPTLILILTDAISDCQSQIPEMQIPQNLAIIFVLLPPDPKRISPNQAEEWLKTWTAAVPEARLVPWVNVTRAWIRQLPQNLTVQVGAFQSGKR